MWSKWGFEDISLTVEKGSGSSSGALVAGLRSINLHRDSYSWRDSLSRTKCSWSWAVLTHYREKLGMVFKALISLFKCGEPPSLHKRPSSSAIVKLRESYRKPWKSRYGISILGYLRPTTFRWSKSSGSLSHALSMDRMPTLLECRTNFCPGREMVRKSFRKSCRTLAKKDSPWLSYLRPNLPAMSLSQVIFMDKVSSWARRSRDL